ncbi:MAG: hypothetical protein JWM89_383, partial [Acidimicrobiales bacterium]|nr:hypothetical protein [Acidimicrobiales bacterium]
YKYRLRVTVPGRDPYETSVGVCASGLRAGQTVAVAAAPHNHKRVTIDLGQGKRAADRSGPPIVSGGIGTEPSVDIGHILGGESEGRSPVGTVTSSDGDTDTAGALDKVSALHDQGALTDEEFAAAKARILGS